MLELNLEDKTTILAALNHYYHHAFAELDKSTLGDIERKIWSDIIEQTRKTMYKIL